MGRKEAESRGKRLLKRMKGQGWVLDVWENLGWHYAVENGPLTVYGDHFPGANGTFSTLLGENEDDRHCGSFNWSPRGKRYKDPNRAVKAQLRLAREYVDSVSALMAGLEVRCAD